METLVQKTKLLAIRPTEELLAKFKKLKALRQRESLLKVSDARFHTELLIEGLNAYEKKTLNQKIK